MSEDKSVILCRMYSEGISSTFCPFPPTQGMGLGQWPLPTPASLCFFGKWRPFTVCGGCCVLGWEPGCVVVAFWCALMRLVEEGGKPTTLWLACKPGSWKVWKPVARNSLLPGYVEIWHLEVGMLSSKRVSQEICLLWLGWRELWLVTQPFLPRNMK